MRPAAPPALDADRFAIRVDPRPPPGRPRSRASVRDARRRPFGAARLLRTAVASTLIIGILVALARDEERRPAEHAAKAFPPTVRAVAPPPDWQPAPGAERLYALDGTPFTVRLHPTLGREDIFAFGSLGEDGPHLRLTLHRGPSPAPPLFFVDLARRAASVGIAVARSGRPGTVETKLGPAEVADAVLAAGGTERACLAFRLERPEVGLGGGGWLCGTPQRPARPDGPAQPGRPATGEHLACLLDELSLATPAPDDPALRALFAQADRRRLARCAPPRVAAEPERIPAELFVEGAAPAEPGAEPLKLGRSRRRERS